MNLKNRNDRWIALSVAATCVIVCSPFIFIHWLNYLSRAQNVKTLAHVTRLTKLKFPPKSVLIEGEYRESLSPSMVAKVSIEAKRLKSFLSQKLAAENLKKGCGFTEKDFPKTNLSSWDLKALSNEPCLSGANRPGETGGLWMIIDERGKNRALIYLYYQD